MFHLSGWLALILGGVAAFFYMADKMRGTAGWANQTCYIATTLCEHPEWPGIAGALVLVVFFLRSGTSQ